MMTTGLQRHRQLPEALISPNQSFPEPGMLWQMEPWGFFLKDLEWPSVGMLQEHGVRIVSPRLWGSLYFVGFNLAFLLMVYAGLI